MYKGLFDLSSRVAVVTGGGRSIGLCIAHALAEFGAKVVIADMNEQTAESGVADLRSKSY